jgi:hypothetical protein
MEYEEITIKIAKPLADFLKAMCQFTKISMNDFWIQQAEDIIEQIIGEAIDVPYILGISEAYELDEYFKKKKEIKEVAS